MTQAVRILFTVFFLCFTDVCFFTKDFGYSSMHSRIYKLKTPLKVMYKIYRPTGTVRGSLTVLQGKHVKQQLECKRKKRRIVTKHQRSPQSRFVSNIWFFA